MTPNGKFHLIVTLIWSIASGQGHATPSDHGQNIYIEQYIYMWDRWADTLCIVYYFIRFVKVTVYSNCQVL